MATNAARSRLELEYELLDTGVFDDDRYVDLDVEYAKSSPEDIHVRLTVTNRSDAPAAVHLLPSLWFRNTWWMGEAKGALRAEGSAGAVIGAEHPQLGRMELRCEGDPALLFTENETNTAAALGRGERVAVREGRLPRLRGGRAARAPSTRPARARRRRRTTGWRYRAVAPRSCTCGCAGRTRRRWSAATSTVSSRPRLAEADEFYASITPAACPPEEAVVLRQALAGMLWGKQLYFFDLDRWLAGAPCPPAP